MEMDEELGRERCQRAETSTPNYRNGYTKKTVKTQLGEVDIKVPRDRNGSFEPKIIGKYSRNADGMEEKILALLFLWDEPAGHRGADQRVVRCRDFAGAGDKDQREDYARGHSLAYSPAGEYTERNRRIAAALSAE